MDWVARRNNIIWIGLHAATILYGSGSTPQHHYMIWIGLHAVIILYNLDRVACRNSTILLGSGCTPQQEKIKVNIDSYGENKSKSTKGDVVRFLLLCLFVVINSSV